MSSVPNPADHWVPFFVKKKKNWLMTQQSTQIINWTTVTKWIQSCNHCSGQLIAQTRSPLRPPWKHGLFTFSPKAVVLIMIGNVEFHIIGIKQYIFFCSWYLLIPYLCESCVAVYSTICSVALLCSSLMSIYHSSSPLLLDSWVLPSV